MSIDEKSGYYDAGGIETIEIIKAKLGEDGFRNYCLGNIIKYASRAKYKGTFDRDLEKIQVYAGMLIKQNAEALAK